MKQNTRREEEKAYHLRMQINKANRRFNQDSERNLTLLEERIEELTKILEASKAPQPVPQEAPSPEESPISSPEKHFQPAGQKSLASFIQNAYVQKAQIPPRSQRSQAFPPPQPPHTKTPPSPDPVHTAQDTQSNKTHQIARLLGEGQSLEDIATTMNMSLGEVKLLLALVKKQLSHSR